MRKNISKKAGVELSLNLIIMLIIGMVVLGLVIAFVNSLMKQGEEGFIEQLNANDKQKLEEIERCSENLCIDPGISTTVEKGNKEKVFIKVRAFDSDIDCAAGDLVTTCSGSVEYEISNSESYDTSGIKLNGPGFKAKEGEEDARMFTLEVSPTTKVGTYYLTIYLYRNGVDAMGSDIEISETITIDVK